MTPQQAKTVEFLKTYSAERNGAMPSFDEIAAHLGIRSKSGVSRIVDALVHRGFVRRVAGKARGLQIIGTDPVLAERERCARIADQHAYGLTNGGAINACRAIALAIRGMA